MKLIIAILILAIVFMAECTQQQSQSKDNIEQISENASKTIHETTESMKARVSIESAINNQNVIKVGIRNTGSDDIFLEKIKAYVNEETKGIEGNIGILNPGQVAMFNVTDATNSCNKIIKIVLSSGLEDSRIIMC